MSFSQKAKKLNIEAGKRENGRERYLEWESEREGERGLMDRHKKESAWRLPKLYKIMKLAFLGKEEKTTHDEKAFSGKRQFWRLKKKSI